MSEAKGQKANVLDLAFTFAPDLKIVDNHVYHAKTAEKHLLFTSK